MTKSTVKHIMILFLLFTAVFTLFRSSMTGVFSLYFVHNGIPAAEVSSIKSFQIIGVLVGLMPAGYLADQVGRLKTLNLSALVIGVALFILVAFSSFFTFALAEFIYGLGLALNSGTLVSYVTGLQKENGLKADKKLMARQTAVLNLSMLVGGDIGTWLFGIDIKLPVWFSILGLTLYPVFTILVVRKYGFNDNRATNTKHSWINPISGLKEFVCKKDFWLLLFLNLGYKCGSQFIVIYWSLIYVAKLHFNLSLVYTLFMIFLILGAFSLRFLVDFMQPKLLVFFSSLSLVVLFVMSYLFTDRYVLLVIFLVIEFLLGLVSSQIMATCNQVIYNEKNKSMFLSTVVFITELLASLSLFLTNFLIKHYHMKIMFLVSALYFLIMLLTIPFLKKYRSDD